MVIEYRTAAAEDIERMVDSRLETLRAVNHLAEDYTFSEDYIAASRKYFLEGDQITVLALDGEETVGCASMCFLHMMPTFSHPSGYRGHLMNVYTRPDHRRQGIGREMVTRLIRAAWDRGATEISLDATKDGRPLYRTLGFTDSDEYMVLSRP